MPHHSNLAHRPYDGTQPLFRIGLSPFAHENWLEPDHCFEDHLAEKRRLIGEIRDKVFQEQSDTKASQHEVLEMVSHYLQEFYPQNNQESDDNQPDLLKAALLVQEDLALLRKTPDGWVLVAGAICFPSSWSLQEKIGKPMHEVHGPVPGFNEGTRNASMIERIFDNLQASQPVERFNWSIYNNDVLYHDRHSGEQTNAKDKHFLRVERQTLTKLPKSGDILFTIRIHVDPIEALETRADKAKIATGFIGLLKQLNGPQLAYKGLDGGRDILISRLEQLAGGV